MENFQYTANATTKWSSGYVGALNGAIKLHRKFAENPKVLKVTLLGKGLKPSTFKP